LPLTLATQDKFWVSDSDTHKIFQIQASLRYITNHAYFWIQNEVSYNEDELKDLAETFESKIYPKDRALFGSEWTPGVDGDPHLYIIYSQGLGKNLLGYFSSNDEYSPLAHEYSNGHEAFLLSEDNLDLGNRSTYGVLAHEFQHMIHWNRDRNEETWLNEGASELAAFINGYDDASNGVYTRNPDMQLNDWPTESGKTGPHYRAAFLFLNYFLSRFGEDAFQALIANPENGLDSIDQTLAQFQIRDPMPNQSVQAEDFFLDWVIANYLQDRTVGDGRYVYSNNVKIVKPHPADIINKCPTQLLTRDVHQFGVDYIRITCPGDYNLHFSGSVQVNLIPVDPYSGMYAFWSNKGDESDMTLTRDFDFTNYTGPLTLSYWSWYDLEKDYDYLYLEASLDVENWQILTTPSGTAEDPSGNSYGWAYNGKSGNWLQEKIDLSQFAGEQVKIRFQYITDAAVNGEGFLLDDVQIPEIGYFTDFENSADGWSAAGWVRVQNILPQTYRLAYILFGKTNIVAYIPLNPDNTADIPLHLEAGESAVLVVTGTTRYTRQTAGYQIELLR